MNSLNESVFVCAYDECSATFSTGTRLEWHMRTHSGERPFECSFPNCGKKYTRRFHLTRHVRTSHTARTAPAEKTFTCQHDECDKVFSSQHSLYKHVRFSHEKRKFQCPHCLKTFIKHQHLSVHSYEHTKVLPFQCTEPGCDKAFLLPSRLKVHQRSHKGDIFLVGLISINFYICSYVCLQHHYLYLYLYDVCFKDYFVACPEVTARCSYELLSFPSFLFPLGARKVILATWRAVIRSSRNGLSCVGTIRWTIKKVLRAPHATASSTQNQTWKHTQ